MSTSSHAEILEYLNHGDADLAVRRLLDYCLDTGQDALISEAIRLSQPIASPQISVPSKPVLRIRPAA